MEFKHVNVGAQPNRFACCLIGYIWHNRTANWTEHFRNVLKHISCKLAPRIRRKKTSSYFSKPASHIRFSKPMKQKWKTTENVKSNHSSHSREWRNLNLTETVLLVSCNSKRIWNWFCPSRAQFLARLKWILS